MQKVVGVQFKGMGRIYYFDPLQYDFKVDEHVIVETVRGLELAKVMIGNTELDDSQIQTELKPVIRKANQKDIDNEAQLEELAKDSIIRFKKIVSECKVDMKPLYCEYTIDKSKIIFYYSADDRVDFRELLKKVTPEFKMRVELRQIGPREAARSIGGIGTCGQEFCCKRHLRNFGFVTMKMAKEQTLSLNANKISGVCGKLMCCIAYENDLYIEAKKDMPKIGCTVCTPDCKKCKVVGLDYVKKTVRTSKDGEAPITYPVADIKQIIVDESNNE